VKSLPAQCRGEAFLAAAPMYGLGPALNPIAAEAGLAGSPEGEPVSGA